MPLDPVISPRIELNHKEPAVFLVRDEEFKCPDCGESYLLDEEGKDRLCVVCMIKKSGKTTIMLFGWNIQRTAGQLIAQPSRP
jgi:hypothetical protein